MTWLIVSCLVLALVLAFSKTKGRPSDSSFEGLQGMETRQLCSATPASIGIDDWGNLNVTTGDGDDQAVVVDLRNTPRNGMVAHVVVGGVDVRLAGDVLGSVEAININLGEGNNQIEVNVVMPSRFIPVYVYTGAGRDKVVFNGVGLFLIAPNEWHQGAHINTGAGRDRVYVNSDQPVGVYAGDGNDLVTTVPTSVFGTFPVGHYFIGEEGNDKLITDCGGALNGGNGNDILVARGLIGAGFSCGRGNDLVRGSEGGDYISTGSGDKTIFGRGGSDYVDAYPSGTWTYNEETDEYVFVPEPLGFLTYDGGSGNDALSLRSEYPLLGSALVSVENVYFGNDGKG